MHLLTSFSEIRDGVHKFGRAVVVGEFEPESQDPFDFYLTVSAQHSPSFFLDSTGASPHACYSYLSLGPPRLVVSAKGRRVSVTSHHQTNTRTVSDPLKVLEQFLEEQWGQAPDLPPFLGGAVGYFGYECAQFLEKLPHKAKDDLETPDYWFGFFDHVLAYDHDTKRAYLSSWITSDKRPDYDKACSLLGQWARRLEHLQAPQRGVLSPQRTLECGSTMSPSHFQSVVAKAKDYIAAGDIYQANLSHRLECLCSENAARLYARLRQVNPSPYCCLLQLGSFSLVSSSPELLLRVRGSHLVTRPIAGTRPRGRQKEEDQQLSAELLLDPKERAEHIMLVDLERNDLGRVCQYGSVRVSELMVLERYSHVIHIVSQVEGLLKPNLSGFEALRALFPGGTITGCPKIRCMEIIDELEPTARGPYTGSAGWMGYNGDMDLNILIRTIVLKEKKAYIQVGAGIVADSDPEREYQETLHKAQAMLSALGASVESMAQS